MVEIAYFNEISASDESLIVEALKLEQVTTKTSKSATASKKLDEQKGEKNK